jgi:uncharacterized protein (TIGR03437 family)
MRQTKAILPTIAALALSACASHVSTQTHAVIPATPAAMDAERPSADWVRLRRVIPGEKEISWNTFLKATAQVAAMPSVSAGAQGWTELGPGLVGGRMRNLLIHPKIPNIMYAGAVTGGVWKTTDGGKTWNPTTDGQGNLTIGAMAFDPQNPNTIFAGEGEEYSYFPGSGILKSNDGGTTWNLLPGTVNSSDFAYVNRIVVSPTNSLNIYAATSTGLLATRDGGINWTKAPISASFYGCQELVARTDVQTDYLLAFCSSTTATASGSVYRNTDAGNAGTWTSVLSVPNMGRSVIGIAPSSQSTIYVVAAGLGTASTDQGFREGDGLTGVFRSTSSGDPGSWVTQTAANSTNPFTYLLLSSTQGLVDSYCANGTPLANNLDPGYGSWGLMIAVDPINPNVVWTGNEDLHRSDDGGLTWGLASLWNYGGVPQYSHADRHGLIFHPSFDGTSNQTIYHLSDGGIVQSDNARAAVSTGPQSGCPTQYQANSKITWTNLNGGLRNSQFWKGAAFPGGQAWIGGFQDNGVNLGTVGNFDSWIKLYGGDGEGVAIDPVNPNRILYADPGLSLVRSVNGGGSNAAAIAGITENKTNFPFSAFLAVDPNETSNVYIGGTTNLWRSSDWAATWTASGATGTAGYITAIAVSPFDSNTVMFGTANGFIFRSTNALSGAGTWSKIQPRAAQVSSIAFDPVQAGVVYAVYSNATGGAKGAAHIYRSTDGGQTWTTRDGSGATAMPDTPTFRMLVNPSNNQTLYVGSDQGLMVSQDEGATWGHDSGLPSAIIEDLAFDSLNPSYLFAFTHGRGAYSTLLPGAPLSCSFSVSPANITAAAEGGVYPVTVSSGPNCAWSAIANSANNQLDCGGACQTDSLTPFQVQAPAQGLGNGVVYVMAPATALFTTSTPAVTGTITVAGQTVTVRQPAQVALHAFSDQAANAAVLPIPSQTFANINPNTATSSPGDPVHSCTGSADMGTAWWQVQPNFTGVLSVQARGDRLDVYGNSGIVLTAYASATPNAELGCATVPRDSGGRTLASILVPVTAGRTYLLELAATTTAGLTSTNYDIAVSMGTAAPVVSVSPQQATVYAGTSASQLTATVAGPANQAVRWSISPALGRISQSGQYTPPSSVAAPTTVTVTATAYADGMTSASSSVTILPPGAISATAAGLVSAATFQGGGVSPGEIITLFGSGFGPSTLAGAVFGPDGNLTKAAGGTTVTFDGVAAPMLYAVNGQLSAIVPYSVAGKATTQMQVNYNGQQSAASTVAVATAAPGLFTANASGTGNAAALNQDYSFNSPSVPAARGSTIVLYGTGEGQTTPGGVDGLVNASVFPKPNLPVQVTIGGVNAQVAYFGEAPGLVSGVFQANVVVPAGITPGNAPVVVTVGTASSPAGVTIAVK